MSPQAMPKSFARVTARSWRLTGKRSGKLRASKWKPVCSRPRWAVCCFTLRRNCKSNGIGWNNFRPRDSKMRFDRLRPTTFDEGQKLRLALAFPANKSNLVIELPGHVIARADVDILVRQARADHRLHRFGFGNFLGRQSRAIQHVQE